MSARKRRSIVALSDISGTSSTGEVDVTDADMFICYANKRSSTNSHGMLLEAAFEPFGESVSQWFKYGYTLTGGAAVATPFPNTFTGNTAFRLPWWPYSNAKNCVSRIRLTGSNASSAFEDIYIEIFRSIA